LNKQHQLLSFNLINQQNLYYIV